MWMQPDTGDPCPAGPGERVLNALAYFRRVSGPSKRTHPAHPSPSVPLSCLPPVRTPLTASHLACLHQRHVQPQSARSAPREVPLVRPSLAWCALCPWPSRRPCCGQGGGATSPCLCLLGAHRAVPVRMHSWPSASQGHRRWPTHHGLVRTSEYMATYTPRSFCLHCPLAHRLAPLSAHRQTYKHIVRTGRHTVYAAAKPCPDNEEGNTDRFLA